jgi:3-demethoxyubiquinol 3-hydroxylase
MMTKGRFGVLFLLWCENQCMDKLILAFDRAARTLTGSASARRAQPKATADGDSSGSSGPARNRKRGNESSVPPELTAEERSHSASLMRVNHAGEVAAQALYQGQALFSRDASVREKLAIAADEEMDHLAWTRARVEALGARTSVLDPLWYAGAFAIGAAAGALGDRISLSFLQATEEQVEAHLASHLDKLPKNDLESRAIVEQMKRDEASHAQTARESGATTLPFIAQRIMAVTSKIMTTTAAKI